MLSISLSHSLFPCAHHSGTELVWAPFCSAMPVRVYLFFAAAAAAAAATTTFHLNYIKKKNISIHKRKTSALRSNEYENV